MRASSLRKSRLTGLASPLLVWLMLSLLIASPWAQAAEISPATARSALVDVLADRGKMAPETSNLTLNDYINIHTTTDENGERGVSLTVPLDDRGRMIPNQKWRDAHPEYCRMQARETAIPSKQLLFKMVKIREAADTQRVKGLEDEDGKAVRIYYSTEAHLVSLGGEVKNRIGKASSSEATWMEIQKSRYALGNPDRQMLNQTLGEALDKLGAKVGKPTHGCGEIRLEHLSGEMVGEPVSFLAGYQGYYGKTLDYRWDFGDGSSNDANSKQVSHVYTEEGTYAVTVHVSGKHIEPGSQTIDVTIKDGLVLDFSSQVSASGNTPERTIKVAATVPLTRQSDTLLTGSAPLRNVQTSVHGLSQVGCAAGSTYGGRLDVSVNWPGPDATGGPQVSLTIPDGERPGVKVSCDASPMPAMAHQRIIERIGNSWWLLFRELHGAEQQADGSFLFEGLEANQEGAETAVVATQASSQSRQITDAEGGNITLQDTITIELRRQSAP